MTTTTTSAIERYLEAVRAELADLGDEERADMIEDVEQHLLEVAAEGDEPLESRLGPPAEYAAELRAAAGFPPKVSDEDVPEGSAAARASKWLSRVQKRLASSAGYREAAAFVRSLQPGWWLLRAYVATIALGVLTTHGPMWSVVSPFGLSPAGNSPLLGPIFPTVFDSRVFGFGVLVTMVVASVAFSRAARVNRTLGVLAILGNVAILYMALLMGNDLAGEIQSSSGSRAIYAPTPGLSSYGKEITNIYPYSADGKPLGGVLLYDQDGQPIRTQPQAAPYYVSSGENGPARLITPPPDNGFPYNEPIYDPNTGAKIGERQRPVIIVPPPAASATPSPSPTTATAPAPAPTTNPAPTAAPTAR
jgi:hypothetical protein